MKLRQKNYLAAGILFCITGIVLICKNSWGRYIDPWLSHGSKFKGHMSYWLVVIGVGMILAAVLLSVIAFSKERKEKTTAEAN